MTIPASVYEEEEEAVVALEGDGTSASSDAVYESPAVICSQAEESGFSAGSVALQDAQLSPQTTRRSSRNRNKIRLPKASSLFFRRVEDLFFKESAAPLGEKENIVQIGSLLLTRVHSSPNIYVVKDFLNKAEIDYFRKKVETGKFERSYVDQMGAKVDCKSKFDSQHRTSSFLSFEKRESSRISSVEQRAADLLGCWTTSNIEPIQLVRYLPGQFFAVHHDMADWNPENGEVGLPPKSLFSKRRLVTIFCYLNTVSAGGATYFPMCKSASGDALRIYPVEGSAVLFCNVLHDGQPDPRTIHAGLTVEEGVKLGLNVWFCED